MPVAGDCHLRLAAGGSSCGSMASRAPNGRAGEGRLPEHQPQQAGHGGGGLAAGNEGATPEGGSPMRDRLGAVLALVWRPLAGIWRVPDRPAPLQTKACARAQAGKWDGVGG